jgi:glycosyltransferase involved in cell wall biosynthesis
VSRLFLDVSSLARWTGPPVGIARVESALARAALSRPNTALCFWDKRERRFRALRPEWTDLVLGWHGAIDVPAPNQSLFSRHRWFSALERLRLTVPRADPAISPLQDALLAMRPHGHRLRDATRRRIAHLPPAMALGGEADIGPNDVLLSAGADWAHLDAAAIAEAKRRIGFRYACLCYDLIPITHPQFYSPEDVAIVTRHWRATLPIADLVIANAQCIAADLARFAASSNIPRPEIAVLPLGYDPPATAPSLLPAPLETGRFILFVSTIEPRKGHAILLRVWRRLLARGALGGFKLVFVGRPGWMVDDVLRDLAATGPDLGVLHLQNLDDAALGALYAHAAFCVYPSQYEGFGLPIIEAFARRKPVLASTGGALPETVAGAFPCLPPDDEPAWERTLEAWIEHPPAFTGDAHRPNWESAAAAILNRAGVRGVREQARPGPPAAPNAPECAASPPSPATPASPPPAPPATDPPHARP